MNLTEFVYAHFHEKVSAFVGATSTLFAPGDIATKIITGTGTGVLVWIITKTISFAIKRLFRKCEK